MRKIKKKLCRGSGVKRRVYAGEVFCRTCYRTFVAIGKGRKRTTFITPDHEKQKPDVQKFPPLEFFEVDHPWEETPFMLQERQRRRDLDAMSFSYGYNHATGKVERIMPE